MILRSVILVAFAVLAALPAKAEVVIFAAASLKEPVDRIAKNFGDVTVSYAGSGTLARQVSLGAPADIVLLANDDWMQVLVKDGFVQPDSVVDFASNRLVLIGPQDAHPIPLTEDALNHALRNGRRLAIGMTRSVPAGIYGRAALEKLGLWDNVADKLAPLDSARAVVTLVARRQVPLGITYSSDLTMRSVITELALFPADSHPPIRYMAGLTEDADNDAAAMLAYLTGPEGQAIFAKAGFLPPADMGR